MSENVVTPEFRVSYPNVFKPKLNTLSKQEEYSVVALFKKGEDLKKLEAAAKEAIEEKWGTDKAKWPAKLKSPFRDQEEKKKEGALPDGHEEGAIFMNLKSKQRPGVVDQNVEPILDETQLYAGCWARASVRAYAYDQAGNRGVAFGLQHLQKVKDDDSLSGRVKAEDAFAPIEGAETGASASDLFG